MKICTNCREIKYESQFYSNRATLSKLDNYCKPCRRLITDDNRGRFKQPLRFVKQAKEIISKGKYICACCGNRNKDWLQIDHIKPLNGKRIALSKESRLIVQGIIKANNHQLLCTNCNYAKKNLKKCPINHNLD